MPLASKSFFLSISLCQLKCVLAPVNVTGRQVQESRWGTGGLGDEVAEDVSLSGREPTSSLSRTHPLCCLSGDDINAHKLRRLHSRPFKKMVSKATQTVKAVRGFFCLGRCYYYFSKSALNVDRFTVWHRLLCPRWFSFQRIGWDLLNSPFPKYDK